MRMTSGRCNTLERRPQRHRTRALCRSAASALFVAALCGGGCSKEPQEPSATKGSGEAPPETILPGQPAPPAQPAPSESTPEEAQERPSTPILALTTRLVTDFEREAQQATPRVDGARGLGGACQSSAECRPGLGCADVVYSGAGQPHIAGGYCSRWCAQDSDCAALAPGAVCAVRWRGTDLSFCMQGCRTGESTAEKCGGRSDVACGLYRVAGVDAACSPSCSSDDDCAGVGRCNAGHGLCDVSLFAVPELSIGNSCGGNARLDSCHGACAVSAQGATSGLCTGSCRLGSTCGEGDGTVCAPVEFALREGDGGTCEQSCDGSQDCRASNSACAPTGFLLASGAPQRGCAQTYATPQPSLAPQRLSVEEMQLAGLPSSVLKVSTNSIFQALSHRLSVESGAVCVNGDVSSDFGGLVELEFQLSPNNGPALDAAGLTGFSFDAEGVQVVRFEVEVPDVDNGYRSYNYMVDPQTQADVEQGPQRISFDQLFNVWKPGTPALAATDPLQLLAVRFSILRDPTDVATPGPKGAGPVHFCVKNFTLESGPLALPDAGR